MNDDEVRRILSWADVVDDSSYYEILGLLEIADALAIKQAFHQFALAFHPDQHTDAPPDVQEAVRKIFKRGAEGYRVLSDAGLRAKYDMAVAKGHLRLESDQVPDRAMVGDVRSLDEIVTSPSAKMSARRADDYLTAGDMAAAKRELQKALMADGGRNDELRERIEAIELAMYAMGG